MHIAMASYTVGEPHELLLGEEESGGEMGIEEDPEFPLPTVDTNSEDDGKDEGI